ncbi:hypothetical protein AX16_006598 [Volvariella volvacea WC 439]|nr:hypothetical protein AX16_006598 [Volvariella volvacea WC 439]
MGAGPSKPTEDLRWNKFSELCKRRPPIDDRQKTIFKAFQFAQEPKGRAYRSKINARTIHLLKDRNERLPVQCPSESQRPNAETPSSDQSDTMLLDLEKFLRNAESGPTPRARRYLYAQTPCIKEMGTTPDSDEKRIELPEPETVFRAFFDSEINGRIPHPKINAIAPALLNILSVMLDLNSNEYTNGTNPFLDLWPIYGHASSRLYKPDGKIENDQIYLCKMDPYLIAGRVDKVKSPSLAHVNTTPLIIFSDGSEKNDHQYASGSAFTAYAQNTRVVSGKKFAGRCTNYEAEIYGMGLGVLQSIADMPLVRIWGEDPIFAEIRHPDHLIIAADNEAAMKCLLSSDTHAAQSLSIPVIRAVRTWLDADDRRTITFIHCPAHKGIELNEMVNKDAKAAALVQPDMGPVPRSIAWERAEIDRKALEIWKNLPAERWGKSSHFLREHSNWKNQGGIHMKKYGSDTRQFAQFVRSLTAHAPIGQFRSQFFPEEPTHCPTCYVYQDRYHVMFECKAARSIPALTPTNNKMRCIRQIQDRNLRFRKHIELSPLKVGKSKTPSIMASYFEWLKLNPIAFTFEGAPPTLPG